MSKSQQLSLPSVNITNGAYSKLMLYIKHCAVEISGLGEIEVRPSGELWITDIFLLKQRGSMGGVVLDDDALAEHLNQYIADGNSGERLRCWWHSHVHMGVFWSAIDQETMAKFSGDYLVSIVGNKQGELQTRLDLFRPFRLTADVNLVCQTESTLSRAIRREVKEKVTIPKASLLPILRKVTPATSKSEEAVAIALKAKSEEIVDSNLEGNESELPKNLAGLVASRIEARVKECRQTCDAIISADDKSAQLSPPLPKKPSWLARFWFGKDAFYH